MLLQLRLILINTIRQRTAGSQRIPVVGEPVVLCRYGESRFATKTHGRDVYAMVLQG